MTTLRILPFVQARPLLVLHKPFRIGDRPVTARVEWWTAATNPHPGASIDPITGEAVTVILIDDLTRQIYHAASSPSLETGRQEPRSHQGGAGVPA